MDAPGCSRPCGCAGRWQQPPGAGPGCRRGRGRAMPAGGCSRGTGPSRGLRRESPPLCGPSPGPFPSLAIPGAALGGSCGGARGCPPALPSRGGLHMRPGVRVCADTGGIRLCWAPALLPRSRISSARPGSARPPWPGALPRKTWPSWGCKQSFSLLPAAAGLPGLPASPHSLRCSQSRCCCMVRPDPLAAPCRSRPGVPRERAGGRGEPAEPSPRCGGRRVGAQLWPRPLPGARVSPRLPGARSCRCPGTRGALAAGAGAVFTGWVNQRLWHNVPKAPAAPTRRRHTPGGRQMVSAGGQPGGGRGGGVGCDGQSSDPLATAHPGHKPPWP